MTLRHSPLLPLCAMLALAAPAAWAKSSAVSDAEAAQQTQAQAFALGYTLRICDLRAIAFTQAVQTLKSVDDDQIAGAEVAGLSRRVASLRRSQAFAYWQTAKILTKLGAPKTLHDWATGTAETLDAPLVYSDEAQLLSPKEPDTATVLAELDEVQAVKASANAQQPTLAAWLKINSGALAVWSSDVGVCAADLHAALTSTEHSRLLPLTARNLLQRAPPGASSETRGDLAELIPRGGGNLRSLATIPLANVSTERLTRVFARLLESYDARKLAEALDGDK